ncbi:MAG: hypothetical protein Aurels2KO_53080 [Aureliella sp.]
MKIKRTIAITAALLLLAVTSLSAMQWGRRGRRSGDERGGVPVWEKPKGFNKDVFTFARVRYSDGYGYGGRGYGRGRWETDFPDSDLNFSLRLHQLTSMKVDPNYKVVDLDSPELFDYPFVYMIEPGAMVLRPAEVAGLRRYCLNGGFLMVDDFWGDYQWANFYREIKKVFPDREPTEVPLEHPIFNIVYPLDKKPQVPAYGRDDSWRYISYEPRHGGGEEEVHYRAIYDDNGRIMVLACHNTDLGDAWEREGMHPDYFEMYSVKQAYPMGVNIVTYAMTH